MRKYRYRKVTPEMERGMKKMKEDGLSYRNIGKTMRLSENTVIYHLDPKQRKKIIRGAEKSYEKMTLEQRKEKTKKHIPYVREYLRKRYNEDEIFRKYYIGLVKKSFKKRRQRWRKEGLCSRCGRERENKQFALCERCREKSRRGHYDGKNRRPKP